MPWHRVNATLEAGWGGGACMTWRSTADGSWGGLDVELSGTAEPMSALDGLADPGDAAQMLTHPLGGYYRRLDGSVAGYRVWHAPMRPTIGSLVRARYDVFEADGLVAPGQAAHSVLLERRSDFTVYLPPTRLARPLEAVASSEG